jgi:hypothetical protein
LKFEISNRTGGATDAGYRGKRPNCTLRSFIGSRGLSINKRFR